MKQCKSSPGKEEALRERLAVMPKIVSSKASHETPNIELEALVASACREDELSRSGCYLVKAPVNAPRATRWTDYTIIDAPWFEKIFIGQLSLAYDPPTITHLLQSLVRAPYPIISSLQCGPRPNCVFAMVDPGWKGALLSFNRRCLCDTTGIWMAHPDNSRAIAALQEECARRELIRPAGLPRMLMTLEEAHYTEDPSQKELWLQVCAYKPEEIRNKDWKTLIVNSLSSLAVSLGVAIKRFSWYRRGPTMYIVVNSIEDHRKLAHSKFTVTALNRDYKLYLVPSRSF